jgi:hypothetical protein
LSGHALSPGDATSPARRGQWRTFHRDEETLQLRGDCRLGFERMRWMVLLGLVGCAQSTRPSEDQFADLSAQTGDLSGFLNEDGGGDMSVDAAPAVFFGDGGSCAPRVNEVQTSISGDSRWEFVEIYNPCPDLYLDGWTLVYRSATNVAPRDGNDSQTLFTFGHVLLPRFGFAVLSGPSYTGPSDGMLAGLGLADDGAVGIRDPSARLTDSVAWGAVSAGHAFVEGTAAPKPARLNAPGQSLARRPDGYDSNDNATDFVPATPTPGGHN